jgi:Ca2+-binding RTX toxin-like protein
MKRALPLLVTTIVGLAQMPAASAGTIAANVVDHILTVTGTGEGDDITIRCESGDVTVNQTQPDGGPEACSTLRRVLVFAGGGADRVSLGDVGPAAFGELVSVSVDGEEGDDVLIGSGIGDELLGGGGFDELRGGGGADLLEPGPGSGSALGSKGRDEVAVTGNVDWSVNDDRVASIPDGDEVTLGSIEAVAVTGGRGDNVISTGSFTGSVTAFGLDGDDLISTGDKGDRLVGGDGNDYMDSGAGNDELEGGRGNDAMRGGTGNDVLKGGPGDDTCTGGPGADSELSC